MKSLIIALSMLLGTMGPAFADDVFVNGYTRDDGTYVSPHHRSAPDGDTSNNWSTRGNTNPYTGERGSRSYGYSNSSGSSRSFDAYNSGQNSFGRSNELYNNGLSDGSHLGGYR